MSVEALEILLEVITKGAEKVSALKDNIDGISKLSGSLKATGDQLSSFGKKATLATAPLALALGGSAKAAIDFESAMADVNKVTNLDRHSAEAKELATQIRSLATDSQIPTSAKGLAEIAAAGGQLGIAVPDIKDFTENVAKMGVAFDISANEAGESVAKMMNVYGLNVEGAVTMGDAINQLSNNSAASAANIVNATTRIGGVARTFGLTNIEAAALANTFIALGNAPEVAGTAITSLLPKLQGATGQTAKFQSGLEMIGISAQEMQDTVEQDAVGAIQMLIDGLAQLDGAQRALATQALLGEGSDARGLATLANNAEAFAKSLALVGDESQYAGSMQAEFEARAATTANQMQLFRNHVTDLGITLGSTMLPAINQLLPKLTSLVDRVAAFAEGNERITQFALAFATIAAVAGPVLVVIGSVISAIGTIAGVIGTVVSAVSAAAAVILPIVSTIGTVVGLVMGALVGTISLPALAIAALAAAFVAAAAAIIANWGRVRPFIASVVAGVIAAVQRMVAGVRSAAAGVLSAIQSLIASAVSQVQALGPRMFSAGAQIIARLAAGIASGAGPVGAAISGIVGMIASKLPGSPVKEGPLAHALNPTHNAGYKISERVAQGLALGSKSVNQSITNLVTPTNNSTSGIPLASGAQPQGGSFSPNVSIVVNANGSESPQETARAFESRVRDLFAELYNDYQAEQSRVSYG